MPRIKVPRKSTAIDMTAMCDVAFLLLSFFILSAKQREPDPLNVNIPSSTIITKLPDKDVAILTVGKEKVFFSVAGDGIKKRTLERMGEKYKINFTEAEKQRFVGIQSFGVPMAQLKNLIAMSSEERNRPGVQNGIPVDTTTNNELYNWVYEARYATKEVDEADMKVSIKGDANENYKTFRKVVDLLQKQKVNKFSLITSAEGGAKQ